MPIGFDARLGRHPEARFLQIQDEALYQNLEPAASEPRTYRARTAEKEKTLFNLDDTVYPL